MAVEDGAAVHHLDRLSSLPDDILIRILSLLPLPFVIVTGCLSTRWHSLWKNVTSIEITSLKSATISEFFSAVCNIVSQITSPFVYTCSVRFEERDESWISQPYDYSWLRQICDHNIRELKLIWTVWLHDEITLPGSLFQTASLVSIKLGRSFVWQLPCDGEPINLPNLRYLSITFWKDNCECLYELIKACPSLEELNLNFQLAFLSPSFKLSNPKLMRLTMRFLLSDEVEIVINTPKLEYLDVSTPLSLTLNFEEEEPRGLREVKIWGCCENLKLNRSIPNVRFLTLYAKTIQNISTVFNYTTHVTLHMSLSFNIKNVQLLKESCPSLTVLSIMCLNMHDNHKEKSDDNSASTLLRGLKMITVESSWSHKLKPRKYFLEFLADLLRNAADLKHFHFKFDRNTRYRMWDAESRQRWELDFCKFLYYSPTISVGCEVEFVGLSLKMSRTSGPKAWATDGVIIPFE